MKRRRRARQCERRLHRPRKASAAREDGGAEILHPQEVRRHVYTRYSRSARAHTLEEKLILV
eukprot:6195639-Pleurochrysis_carterae.AAC.3